MSRKNTPLVLVILDGWGMALPSKGNAISLSKTPCFDFLWKKYSHTRLAASGEAVGLPRGADGNSEVGHMNMGAGRIVTQDVVRINECIENGSFFQNSTLLSAIHYAQIHNSDLHLMGLFSDGLVHSDIKHLKVLLELCKKEKVSKVYIHGFLDGRDTPPKSALKYIDQVEKWIKEFGVGKIVSVCGRYYAMDRAHKWDRTQKVFNMMIHGKDKQARSAREAVEQAYKQGITDEFIEPTFILYDHQKTTVQDNDAIIFFNLRSDRARQMTKPYVLDDFKFFDRGKMPKNIFFVGLTNFGDDLPMLTAFPEHRISKALPETLSKISHYRQLYVAEEEKFGPVAYFFHGGFSIPFENENRIMIKSKNVATYDLTPEMSAGEINQAVLQNIKKYDFIVMNYANPDMLGHTGNIKAAIIGLEFVDKCLAKIIDATMKENGTIIVTADHGNVEEMIDPETGEVDTEHSTNPVPFIIVSSKFKKKELPEGILGDVAPTVLDIMDQSMPKDMTGKNLLG